MPALRLRSRLRGADLRAADLGVVRLEGEDLVGADLRGVDLSRRSLRGADLRHARLDGATLHGCDLSDSRLDHASFAGADATGARFDRSLGDGVDATGLVAPDSSWTGAEWPRARLDDARLGGASLRGARFDGASMNGVGLERCDLRRAVLDDVRLHGGALHHARASSLALRGARGAFSLRGADLRGADLRDVPFSGLDVTDARLDGATVDPSTARRYAALLTSLGWSPSAPSRALAGVSGVVAAAPRTLRESPVAQWVEAWRRPPEDEDEAPKSTAAPDPSRPAAPGAEPPPAADEDEVDEEAFVQAAVLRVRRAEARALARERAARLAHARAARRQAAGRPRAGPDAPAVAEAPEPRRPAAPREPESPLASVPSEIRDAVRALVRARAESQAAAAQARDVSARVRARTLRAGRGASPASPAPVTARQDAADQAAEAWRARLAAVRVAEAEAREAEVLRRAAEAAERAQREAAAAKARREAEAAAAERARREAEAAAAEQARREAEAAAAEQARREAEAAAAEQARREAEAAAAEQARREAEAAAAEQARREAEAAAAEQARREAEAAAAEPAGHHAEAAAAEPARREAEAAAAEQARREAEAAAAEQARREAEAAAAEQARREAEAAAAEQARREAEAAAERERREAEVAAARRAVVLRLRLARIRTLAQADLAAERRRHRDELETRELVAAELDTASAPSPAVDALASAARRTFAALSAGWARWLAPSATVEAEPPPQAGAEPAPAPAAALPAPPTSEDERIRLAIAAEAASAGPATWVDAPWARVVRTELRAALAGTIRRLVALRGAWKARLHPPTAPVSEVEPEPSAAPAPPPGGLAHGLARVVVGATGLGIRVLDTLHRLTDAPERLRDAVRELLRAVLVLGSAVARATWRPDRRELPEEPALPTPDTTPEEAAARLDRLRADLTRAPDLDAEEEARLEAEFEAETARVRAERLDAFRRATAASAARLEQAARAGVVPALRLAGQLVRTALLPIVEELEGIGSASPRELARAILGWVWGGQDAEDPLTLEAGLEFARDAEDRAKAVEARAIRRAWARQHEVRAQAHERRTGGRTVIPLAATRGAAVAAADGQRWHRAVRAVRVVRHEEATVAGSLAAAQARRSAGELRRAMAEDARRAQRAREVERRRQREEWELMRLREAAEVARSRLLRVERDAAAAGSGGADPALLLELQARAEARAAEVEAQLARVQAARDAQLADAEAEAADRRKRVLRAFQRGVGRLRGARRGPTVEAAPGADLSARSLDELDFAGADLRGANLRGSTLVGADLRGADLREADLREVDFTGARLDGARFDGADLQDTILDQVEVDGASFTGVRAAGARIGAARGLSAEGRAALLAGGAETPTAGDSRGTGLIVGAVALTAAVFVGFYLMGRYSTGELDAAGLAQAATEARQRGDDAGAARALAELSRRSEGATRIDTLLDAVAVAEEAGQREEVLTLFDEALAAAEGTPELPRVRLVRAQALTRLGLDGEATTEFRALLARTDVTPDQAAAAVVGLHQALGAAGADEVVKAETVRLDAMATDPERGAFALALADAWAGANDPVAARRALTAAIERVTGDTERIDLRLRLARAEADAGEPDAALASYAALADGPRGGEARLGAAELLERLGRGAEAAAALAPLLDDTDPDVRARALLAAATTAERSGDVDGALGLVRRILAVDGAPPNVLDGGRILLARLDPTAVDDLVAENPELASALRLGRAQALREAGELTDAQTLLVALAEDTSADAPTRWEATLALAELQVERGDTDDAVRRYDTLLRQDLGRDLRARASLGRSNALLRGNRVQEAEVAFLAQLASGSPEVQDQCRLGLARINELRGRPAQAAELYRTVGRSSGPWAVEALLALGQLHERAGELPEAVEAYRLARSRPGAEASRRTAAEIALAQALDASGDRAGAAEVFASLLDATDPTVRAQARLAVAETAIAADPARARALLEEALAALPPGDDRDAARALWVRAAVASGDSAAARARLDAWLGTAGDGGARDDLVAGALRALRVEGDLEGAQALATRWGDAGFEAGMESALTLREAGQVDEAAARLRALDPATAEDEAWRDELLAGVLADAGDYDGAARAWDAVAESDPAAARFGRGRVARLRGDPAAALTLLADSKDPRAAEERGLAYEALGKLDEAEAAYASMVDDADLERRSAARVGQARVRLARDDAKGALAALALLPVVDPGYALTVAQLRGEALLAQDRIGEAEDTYRALTQDAEARTVGALGLGECALARGDTAGASARFGEAFEGTTDRYYQAGALAGLARAYTRAQRPERAAATLSRLESEFADFPDALARAREGAP